MKLFLVCLLSFFCLFSFSQITFDKAYFIDNNGLRTDCLIKNPDWVANPVNFEFKLKEDDVPIIMDISQVKEFGITNFSKYVKAEVNIDRSNTKDNEVDHNKEPMWSKELVFLKVLIDGKAMLYYFEDGFITRFFYSIDNSPIQQLVFKEFYGDDGLVRTNNTFRLQLWTKLKCESIPKRNVENLEYNQNDLEKYFKKYYECTGDTSVDYNKIVHRDLFNVTITPGITYSKLSIIKNKDKAYQENYDYGSQMSFRMGIEIEYIFAFNRNKWGVIFEPTYQYFTGNSGLIKLNFIEYPIGLRHYLFLNEILKTHINILYIPGFCTDLSSKFNAFEIDPIFNLAIGAGINYRKFSAELRYYSNRNIIKSESVIYPDYQKVSFVIGYQLF